VVGDEPQVSVGGLLEQEILGKFWDHAGVKHATSQQRSNAHRRQLVHIQEPTHGRLNLVSSS
jgi:hypothetical protein